MPARTWNRWLVVILFACWAQTATPADPVKLGPVTPRDVADLRKIQERTQKVAEKVQSAVVAVEVAADLPGEPGLQHHQLLASGVIISPEGLILSQYHVSHLNDQRDYEKSRKPGERVKIILSDGTKLEAELLGADRTADLSLLRLIKPGRYPHVPVDPAVTVGLGDWVMKLGHPLGYRPGRPPVVRLGRVLCRRDDTFVSDCPMVGGDSGGPLFDLDGRLVGVVRDTRGTHLLDAWDTVARGIILFSCSSSPLIHSRLPAMQKKELAAWDAVSFQRMVQDLQKEDTLPSGQWTQGTELRKAYREVVKPSRPSVVAVRDGKAIVALGTIVGSEGWILTKASELPGKPQCELPDGRVLDAEVVGVDTAFDLALLRVAATQLTAIEWAEGPDPAAGTLVAVSGTGEVPPAIGVVSVPRRDLEGPFPAKMTVRPKTPAALPEMIGSAVQGRGYWVEFVEGPAADAGIRPGDMILTIGGTAVRSHQDLAGCVRGRWAGESVPVRLLRSGMSVELTMRLRAYGDPSFSVRADDFPTVFEHDAPVLARECGGPVAGLDGKALGVTIARVGPHGCMAIPGDSVRKLLPGLQSGKMAENWVKPQPVINLTPLVSKTGKPVTLTVDELKKNLTDRRDRFKSLLVEYDVISEAHVEPRLLIAWKLHTVRDYQMSLVIAFAGERRFAQVRQPEVLLNYAPKDLVTADPMAPPAVAQAIERDRRVAAIMRTNGRFGHLFVRTGEEESRSVFDGEKCFVLNEFSQGRMVEAPPQSFNSSDMYLSGLGLRPLDPSPREELKKVQRGYWFPENFAGYTTSRLLPEEEYMDGAACVVMEATSDGEMAGKRVKWTDRIWFDSELGYVPRKWEHRQDGVLSWVRTNTRFEEFTRGCWLPLESTWTRFPPPWVAPEFGDRPAYSYNMRLRTARVNDLKDEIFRFVPAAK